MKKTLLILSIICAACIINPPKAQAGGEWEAVAGFFGGLIVGKALDNHHTTVHHDYHYNHCEPRGYYKRVRYRVWNPGRCVTTVDRCGREIVYRTRGYYSYKWHRVWVEY